MGSFFDGGSGRGLGDGLSLVDGKLDGRADFFVDVAETEIEERGGDATGAGKDIEGRR